MSDSRSVSRGYLPRTPAAAPSTVSPQMAPRPFDADDLSPSTTGEARILHNFSNVAVTAPVQAKLTVGQPGDPYEQEVDLIADQVMTMPDPGQAQVQRMQEPEEEELQMKPSGESIQRLAKGEEEDELQMKPLGGSIQRMQMPEEEELQMQPLANSIQRMQNLEDEEELQMKAADASAQVASPNLETSLNQSKGGGAALDEAMRSFIEPRMGFDFSQVRIHNDSQAVQMNQQLGARAFTHGSDIYFGAGQYNPGSNEGKRLLSHELTHVVQQSGGGLSNQIACDTETRTDSARQQFESAQTAYQAGDYATALRQFQATYALISGQQRASIAYNMGVCHQALGQFDATIDMYQEYLNFAGISRRDRALVLEQIRRARTGESTIATEPPTATTDEQTESTRSAQQLFEEGQSAFAARDYALALRSLCRLSCPSNLNSRAGEAATKFCSTWGSGVWARSTRPNRWLPIAPWWSKNIGYRMPSGRSPTSASG